MNHMSLASMFNFRVLTLGALLIPSQMTFAGEIFADDFNDNSLDAAKWITWGTSVVESEQVCKVLQNKTDAGGNIKSTPIPINAVGAITLTRDVRLHYSNDYFMGETLLNFGTLPQVRINYGHIAYDGTWGQPVYGFYITKNNTNPHTPRGADPANVSTRIEPIWDTWFTESIIYNPQTGVLYYLINSDLKTTFNVGAMPVTENPALAIQFTSWAWWTGHQHFIDNLTVTQDQVFVAPKPEFVHNPAEGRQSVKDFRLAPGGQCAFTFSTADPGSMCIVSWTSNFNKWFPLIHFNTTTQGTEVLDTPRDPSKFYRAAYLPAGVSAAESFDYPVGSGVVDEQISPERNDLYPNAPIANPERGSTSPGTGWYNVQDVGSYYSTFGGLHGGEDWNRGSGTADVGEQVRAIANGQVIDIRPAHSAGAPHSGYAVLVRHWLLNGDTVDSLYVHAAPDKSGGSANTAGVIGPESDFSFQEGSPVSKGDVIGVIGAVTSPAMTPHLHFEMRTKQTVPNDLWPNDTGDGYYGPVPGTAGNRSPNITAEEVQAAFLLMQKDGIIDPSDFIDDHR